ncbi:hypothetical protein GCM10010992_24570 [Cloacibacterium rupense]|uniref:Cytosol aminopeptidase domain-containing protein n=1 Tax=Cloacibacterium rupense TaxID=517423 RepID=A0ABQ2NN08_9FLAO|nr:leucyl aminopeptidase family protein [Cloacibacterium rupense]GGP06019.1 hypothetical protein GCM10010992_24570 [Cloacibacterium rupense]
MIEKINIQSKTEKNYSQIFEFISEETWETKKDIFDKNTSLFFSGKKNETFVLIKDEITHFLIGTGKSTAKNHEIKSVAQKFAYDFRNKISATPTLLLADNLEKESIVKGLFLGTYEYPFSQNHLFFNDDFSLEFDNFTENISKNTLSLCNGQFAAMDWLNKPANYKKVLHISEFLKNISEKYSLKYSCFDRKKCEELGLGAFLSVNQGSSQEAAFTILEYNCGIENAKTVGLVGKCVLFDTGGISIKPSANLHYMKSDMGGATAVIGALITAAERKTPANIIAILPITDNAVANNAYLPSDVIKAYNGKTIEVLDTDAEGRMTLADGLSYLSKNYKTDVLLDLATLTGSSVRMFGYTCGALFSNDKNLKNALENAGDKTNQRLWNLPLWDIWKDEISSDVADYKNISMKPFGDCIVAAKFLEQFIENHPSWAHLDIAGVAFGNVSYAKEKAATGYGVELLTEFLETLEVGS